MNNQINTEQAIEEKYSKLPEPLKRAINSPDLMSKVIAIGKQNDLMIDQIGQLRTNVLLTMLGLQPSSTFTDILKGDMGVPEIKANKIAAEINTAVFQSIKTYLAEFEEENETEEEAPATNSDPRISSVEKVGGFTVEKHGEIPKFEKPAPTEKANPAQGNTHVEAIVENLLTTPNIQHEQIINKSASVNNAGVSINPSTDPYREEF